MLGADKIIKEHGEKITDIVMKQCIEIVERSDDKYDAIRNLKKLRGLMREDD